MKTPTLPTVLLLAAPLFAGLGDIDNDGTVTLNDCKQLAVAVAAGTPVDLSIADIDGDGKVTIVDAMRLHQSIGGLWIEPTGAIQPVPELSPEERIYFTQYEELCDRYEAMSPDNFLATFQAAPVYTSTLDPQQCTYFTRIDSILKLTDEQKQLLKTEGMVVLKNNMKGAGFGTHYVDVYRADLPVFFTSDALLDPLYKLYDDALREVETVLLIPKLQSILTVSLTTLKDVATEMGGNAAWNQTIADVRSYLLVAQALLNGEQSTSDDIANGFLDKISSLNLVTGVSFFGEVRPSIDFSQFKPRGHYECGEYDSKCTLAKYFRCMMWLGRADCAFTIDSLRQLRAFVLIHELMKGGSLEQLSEINQVISFFVGDVDGFSLEGLSAVREKNPITVSSVITSDAAAKQLLAAITATGGANQLILSQAMWKDADAARPELPKIAQICGQRFILDSYLLGRTVEAYVKKRSKPLLEEVAFCLGNNAATSVIAGDATTYTVSTGDYKPYHARLGACRVLFDNYPYMERNLYTLWLGALQSLSDPLNADVPMIMRSRGWQDKQMNTQLASWAQLRHNTLLYAKQSYTAGITCFYPDGYVEPYPDFYRTIGKIMRRLKEFNEQSTKTISALRNAGIWIGVTDTLAGIAETELKGQPLTPEHIAFLNRMLDTNPDDMCGLPPYIGWYPQLYASWDDCFDSRPCIADVHTIPPSDVTPSNMVLHAATGDASKIIIQASTGNDCGTLYIGAVSSFYQHDESPVKRLTDSEWTTVIHGSEQPGVPAWFGRHLR